MTSGDGKAFAITGWPRARARGAMRRRPYDDDGAGNKIGSRAPRHQRSGERRAAALTPLPAVALLQVAGPDAQSALHPAGPQAARIAGLWWLALAISIAVFVIVIGALLVAATRRTTAGADEPEASDPGRERTLRRVVGAATGVTVLTLFVWLIASVSTGRALTRAPGVGRGGSSPLVIGVTGKQWWWEVRYPDTVAAGRVVTANEIHIPVGRPVVLEMTSTDVIHSFWAPNLNGKRDLLPGYITSTWFQADTPGVWRAQCAEFCGPQHAHMALLIVAEPAASFGRWLADQQRAAPPPADSLASDGRRVFLANACAMCHTIRGTDAHGHVGPDLTHVASRLTLAAGTLANTPGSLAGWIANPQALKPGAGMPQVPLSPAQLQAVVTYLEGLR